MSDAFELLTNVGPKPFLNINCNNVNCNVLTANQIIDLGSSSSLFNYAQSGLLVMANGASTSTACDTFLIASTDFTVSTNTYTAPLTGNYRFDLQANFVNLNNPQDVYITLGFLVNSVSSGVVRALSYPAATPLISNSSIKSDLIHLNVGDTVNYIITNVNSVVNTIRLTGCQFMGVLLG